MLFLIPLILVSTVLGCNITTTLRAETFIPFYAQFTFHNGTESPLYYFDSDHTSEKLQITGTFCNLKPTVLKVWKEERPMNDTKPFGQTSAFVEGMGKLEYKIYGNSPPHMHSRTGIFCGFGDCGARG